MQPFHYHRAASLEDAVRTAHAHPGAAFIAGGSDLLPLWKADIIQPPLLIDISQLPLAGIDLRGTQLALGALVRMSDAASHPLLLEHAPAIAQALLASASPQIRNQATLGGNLLQRTRCSYFRHRELPCNKRAPGSGCGALQGEHRNHAIFGTSEQCIAAHASDFAVALVAADAHLRIVGARTQRCVPIDELFAPADQPPQRDHRLAADEVITEILIPTSSCTRRSHFLKVRDRASFEFALTCVAAGLSVDAGRICDARVVAGGVGPKPWRLQHCEELLLGEPPLLATFERAAAVASQLAAPLQQNRFKVSLLERVVLRALQTAAGDSHDG